jgi:hypothetical protein
MRDMDRRFDVAEGVFSRLSSIVRLARVFIGSCMVRSKCPSCNDLITSERLLDYSTGFQLEFCENSGSLLLTFAANVLGLGGNDLITSGSA